MDEKKVITMKSSVYTGEYPNDKKISFINKLEPTIESNVSDISDVVLTSAISKDIIENAILLNPTHSACWQLKAKMTSGFGYYFEGKKNSLLNEIVESPSNELHQSFGYILNNLSRDFHKRAEFGLAIKLLNNGKYILKYCNISNLRVIPNRKVVSTSESVKGYLELQDTNWYDNQSMSLSIRKYTPLKRDTIIRPNVWYLARYWTPSSNNPFFPEPEYISALYPIAENKKINDYNSVFFDNNARPDFILTIKGVENMKTEDATNITTFIQNNFKGRLNAHRTLYLQFDDVDVEVEVIPIEQKSNSTDGSFRLLRMDNRDDIARAWNVPPKVIGISSTGSLGSGSEALGALKVLKEYIKSDQLIIETFMSDILKKLTGVNPKLKFRRIELTNEKDKAVIYNLLASFRDNNNKPILPYSNVSNDLDLEDDVDNKRFIILADKIVTNNRGETRADSNLDESNKNKMGNTNLKE